MATACPKGSLVWAGVALALTPGCICSGEDTTETLAKLDSPIGVRLTHQVRWRHGHGPGDFIKERYDTAMLEFDAGWTHSLDCTRPQPKLFADGAGERLAVRCSAQVPWTQIFVGKTDVLWAGRSDLGRGAEPDWSMASSLEDAAVAAATPTTQFRCDEKGAYQVVLELRGVAAVAKLLLRLAPVEGCQRTEDGPPPWDEAFGSLPPELQDEVRTGVREQLERAKEEPLWLLRRASAVLPLERTEVAELCVRRARTIVDRVVAAHFTVDCPRSLTVAMLLRRLAVASPEKAGELACRALRAEGRPQLLEDAHGALAHTRTACQALREALESDETCRRTAMATCAGGEGGSHVCTPEELAPIVADWASPSAKGPGQKIGEIEQRRARLRLAAAYVQGDLPCLR